MGCLRVGIECRIENFRQGIGTAILSLAHSLCESSSRTEHYIFILYEDHETLFENLPRERATLIVLPRTVPSPMKSTLGRFAPLKTVWAMGRAALSPIPSSDGIAESQNLDIIHFPTQVGYHTKIPSVYQPWDLQHIHLPHFFSFTDRIWRNRLYKALCQQARVVSVQTQWGKNDLIQHYRIHEDKIAVIPWGSVLNAYPQPDLQDIQTTRDKFKLPEQFLFFPAITWPHKNHEVVIRALAELKQNGIIVFLVCTGDRTVHYSQLQKLAMQCGVYEQLIFLGFVSPLELRSIYALATAMIFPSRFEGFGLPILEAFQSSLPVLCAHTTVLPEVAGDAALFFNPDDPIDAARVIRKIIDSPHLRAKLIKSGLARSSSMTIDKAAKSFRDLYHKIASS